jgi:hypothetical protein
MQKKNYKSLVAWAIGFITGVIGVISNVSLLYILGIIISIIGILIFYIPIKKKQVWRIILEIFASIP